MRTRAAARDAMTAANAEPVAVGITNQRETVVVWERATGKPVHRAIVWQDRRTARRCQELAPRTQWIADRTGLLPDPYFSASKLEWVLQEGRLLERYKPEDLAAGTIDTWLVWQLTGGEVHATDPTNASRTMLYDIGRMQWSDELCDLFGVPRALLPEVRRSSGDFGVARASVLGAEAPILGIAGDQQAALFGQGCWTRGTGKIRTAPARFSCSIPATSVPSRAVACSRRSRATRRVDRSTRSKRRSSSRGLRSNGSATDWAS